METLEGCPLISPRHRFPHVSQKLINSRTNFGILAGAML